MTADLSTLPVVILVNDDPLQLDLLTGMLGQQPWQVVACRSANEALQAMSRHQPALVITDLYMPDIDGWAFCRMLRSAAYKRFNLTPILVLSGILASEEAAEIASELGATDFSPLPVEAALLRERVRMLIETPPLTPAWKVLLAMAAGPEADAVRAVFGAQGCEVSQVEDIAAVDDVLSHEPWEAVICDLDLPDCSMALVRMWIAATPHSAFVLVTANPDPQAAVTSIRAGASVHTRRPYAPDYLFGLCELARQKNSLIRAQRMLELRTVELRNSDRLIQSILDSSDQVYLVIDRLGGVEMANRAARQIAAEILPHLAQSEDAAVAQLPALLSDRTKQSLALAMVGQVVHHDSAVSDASGRRRRFMVRYTPLPDADGRTARVCFNAQDMTARIEAEDALRLRNHALSSISQGVLITDAELNVTYANDSFVGMTGFSRSEIIGLRCGFLHAERTDAEALADIRRKLDAGLPFSGEVLDQRKNGESFWSERSLTPVKDAQGTVTQYVGVQRDITDRKRQQDELRYSQARLQALFDHSNDAIMLVNDSGRYVEVNPAACALLGYSREELLKLGVGEIFSKSEHGLAEGAWHEFLETGTQRGECSLRRKDGTLSRADYSAIAHIQNGLHLTIFRDVSESHALQSQLLRQQRLESVGRLASGVAHDLNNILTPILMAPAMLRGFVTDAGARMLLESMESGARRGSAIVQQLLAFSRGEAGEKVRLDLQKTLRESCAIMRETFPKSVAVEFAPAAGDFFVVGDPNQLQQVVLNLALNAADAMPRGGRLVLSLEAVEISPGAAARDPELIAGRHAVLTVVDHGTGIAPEILDKIFDPFFTTKPFGQGSGLGLSVVLGIVRSHGGFVRVTSRVGVGTIFKVHLPLQADVLATSPQPAKVPAVNRLPPAGAGRTVLVIDDEADVRDIIRLTLSHEGYRVIGAAGADAAFSQLQACGGRVDLILTDLSMPGVSGVKLIEMLHGRHPEQRILVMTGNGANCSVVPKLRDLVCGILPKPFEVSTLVLAVNQALQSPAL
ncbi:MAG: response regulator [Opitutus sp.]|nr:response regulator [Opitutus sp.]MCS6277421.1 response regulator [Opitutus sp.]